MVHIKISFQHDNNPTHDTPNHATDSSKVHVAQYRGHRRAFMASTAIILILFTGVIWFLHNRDTSAANPIPASVQKQLSFQLYYPASLPAGYTYDKNGMHMSGGVLFYAFSNTSGQHITVSEQTKPANQLALSSLVGFSPLQNSIGQGVIGTQGSASSALLETSQTLITVSGTQDVSSSIISQLTKALSEVK